MIHVKVMMGMKTNANTLSGHRGQSVIVKRKKCFLSECWNLETMIFVKEKKESQNIATATVIKPWFHPPHHILHQ